MPTLNCLEERKLSAAGADLVQFDADSIRQIVRARQGVEPDVWVVDPERYEKNGRVLRDSELPRMLAYSINDGTLYATDGCNSCAKEAPEKLQTLVPAELKLFAEKNDVPLELLHFLLSLL